MANCCDTSFTIISEKEEIQEEKLKQMQDWLSDNIAHCDNAYIDYIDANLVEGNVCTRWNVPEDKLQEFCKLFKVKLRAIGREDGVGFVQVVCINDNGELVQNEEIGYAF